MNVGDAIGAIKMGRYVNRPAWGHRVYLLLEGDTVTYSRNGYDSPWAPTHPDLLADDWEEIIPHP